MQVMLKPTRVEHLPLGPIGKAFGLTHKHYTRLERHTGDKHYSLLRKIESYEENKGTLPGRLFPA
jgi:hypothetical protein